MSIDKRNLILSIIHGISSRIASFPYKIQFSRIQFITDTTRSPLTGHDKSETSTVRIGVSEGMCHPPSNYKEHCGLQIVWLKVRKRPQERRSCSTVFLAYLLAHSLSTSTINYGLTNAFPSPLHNVFMSLLIRSLSRPQNTRICGHEPCVALGCEP